LVTISKLKDNLENFRRKSPCLAQDGNNSEQHVGSLLRGWDHGGRPLVHAPTANRWNWHRRKSAKREASDFSSSDSDTTALSFHWLSSNHQSTPARTSLHRRGKKIEISQRRRRIANLRERQEKEFILPVDTRRNFLVQSPSRFFSTF
jgi:hypothetical protein